MISYQCDSENLSDDNVQTSSCIGYDRNGSEIVSNMIFYYALFCMMFQAENSFGDISGKVVADFGCGCGTLGVASALLGAEWVVLHSYWVMTYAFFSESLILLHPIATHLIKFHYYLNPFSL